MLAVVAACNAPAQRPTVAHAWPVMDMTLSLAAWGPDSVELSRGATRVIDAVRSVDSVPKRELIAKLRAWWATARGMVRREPDWEEVSGGYALDRAAAAISAVADSALLDLSGQYLWIGPATRRVVGIPEPDNSLNTLATVELQEGSVRTKAEAHRSLTVLAPTAMAAAAWASVLFPLGCDSAVAMSGVPVVCGDSTGVRWSADLKERVRVPSPIAPGP